MKKSTLIALISFVSISMFAVSSQAQAPCGGGIVGIGPFGIGVVIDCPPPVVVVRPRIVHRVVHPRPRVVIVERRGGCYDERTNAPCRRPVRRYRRPVRRAAPVVAAPVVAAPTALNTQPAYMDFSRFSLGVHIDSSSYEDGGLMGSGVNAKYMINRHFGVEASAGVLTSCTNCNEYSSRTDSRFGIAGLYYLGGRKDTGMNLFLKGGLVFNNITFNNDVIGDSMDIQQTNVEFGGGLELKLSRSFGIYAEMTGMVAGEESDTIGTGPIPESMAKGIPASNIDNPAFNFKAGISYHF